SPRSRSRTRSTVAISPLLIAAKSSAVISCLRTDRSTLIEGEAVQLSIYDTLQRRVLPLTTERAGEVRMYTCGPTVYRPAHLGNLRSYLLADWIRRTLEHFGNTVVAIKNITDVGHMRQDAVDRGEDKVIAAALAEGKTPKQIAEFYEVRFHEDERRLGILPATRFPRATDHVPEMISIIERLIARGLAYEVEGAVYFAVKRFAGYGRLSGNVGEALRQGVRAEIDPNKRDPVDFALWKKAEAGRALTWESPWGRGFPGWHIECSAMSTKYLGERFDLHTGGVDNIFPHHEDEIAQSEGAYGHASVRHWVHGQHLLSDGVKMAKSARNTVTIDELIELEIDPLAFRYQCLLTHYRTRMHFSLGALRQAAEALDHLRQRVRHWSQVPQGEPTRRALHERWLEPFGRALADDLNLPAALAWLQRCAVDRTISDTERLAVFLEADRVLGLDLASVATEHAKAPREVVASVEEHRVARASRDFQRADDLRAAFDGYRVEDQAADRAVLSRADRRVAVRERRTISSAKEVPDRRSESPARSWTVGIVTREYPDDLARCLAGALAFLPADGEVFILDSGSRDEAQDRIAKIAAGDGRVKAYFADRDLGEGAARNALIRGDFARPTSSTSTRSRPATPRRCRGTAPPRGARSCSRSAASMSATASTGISTSPSHSRSASVATAWSRWARIARAGTRIGSWSRFPKTSDSSEAGAISTACTGGFTANPDSSRPATDVERSPH
ncbi:MAG: cysteine--tRNA ligase, partial [Chloroflexi bacterium]